MSQISGRVRALAALLLTFALTPPAVHAQDAQNPAPATAPGDQTPPPPAAPTDQTPPNSQVPPPAQPTDQAPPPPSTDQQPTYQGGVPTGPSPPPQMPPPPPPPHHPHIILGINAGVFVPSSGKARNRFGDDWWSTGIGIGAIHQASGHGNFGFDLRTQYQTSSNDERVFVGAVGVEYRRRFDTDPGAWRAQYVPYYGATLDVMGLYLNSPEDNVSDSLDATVGGSVFVGTTVGQQEFIEVRYQALPDVQGFNLSGTSLTAGVRFY